MCKEPAANQPQEAQEPTIPTTTQQTQQTQQQNTFTIQDVTSHNTPKSAYTLYQNRVLDITSFATHHPGGDIILLAAGKDATVLIETYHPRGVPKATIQKLTIGHVDQKSLPKSYYDWSSPFYRTLSTRVIRRLNELNRPLRGSNQIQIKAAMILFGFWFSLYKMYTTTDTDRFSTAILWSMTMGVFAHWVGTCIQHDGNHGAFSVNKRVNVFAGWTFDMIGGSAFTWQFQHMLGHHPYTNLLTTSTPEPNLAESDPDVFSSYPLMRMHPLHETKWYHAYQHLYAPILFAGMTLAKVFQQDVDIILSKKLYHIDCNCRYADIKNVVRFWVMKVLTVGYMIGLPMWFHGVKNGLMLFVIGHLTCGEVLATMFIVNHVIEGVSFANVNQTGSNDNDSSNDINNNDSNSNDNDASAAAAFINRPRNTKGVNPMEECQAKIISESHKVPYNDWAAVQCQTSVNWSKGSWFWNHFSGGLNHQIEHHLFPSICHTNYVYIQDVVEDTCTEFGVPYQSEKNLFVAYGHMLKHLRTMGLGLDVDVKKQD